MKPYRTVLKAAGDEQIIQRSRFIGDASPAASAEEALAFLEAVRARHRDATHHCYAYIIGQNAGIMRYSDDGEPSGTAGLPIIEVMKARGVVDCCVVVTRYFGGVLLGAGGLTRAYAHTCAIALDAAGVCVMHPTETWLAEVPYALWDRVRHELAGLPARLESTEFTSAVAFEFSVKAQDSQRVRDCLARVTDGRAEMLLEGESHSPWLEG